MRFVNSWGLHGHFDQRLKLRCILDFIKEHRPRKALEKRDGICLRQFHQARIVQANVKSSFFGY